MSDNNIKFGLNIDAGDSVQNIAKVANSVKTLGNVFSTVTTSYPGATNNLVTKSSINQGFNGNFSFSGAQNSVQFGGTGDYSGLKNDNYGGLSFSKFGIARNIIGLMHGLGGLGNISDKSMYNNRRFNESNAQAFLLNAGLNLGGLVSSFSASKAREFQDRSILERQRALGISPEASVASMNRSVWDQKARDTFVKNASVGEDYLHRELQRRFEMAAEAANIIAQRREDYGLVTKGIGEFSGFALTEEDKVSQIKKLSANYKDYAPLFSNQDEFAKNKFWRDAGMYQQDNIVTENWSVRQNAFDPTTKFKTYGE